MIPALKRDEDDVGSYLQKDTAKSLFHLQKKKVPTLNENSHRFHLFFSLRPPKSFDRLSSQTTV